MSIAIEFDADPLKAELGDLAPVAVGNGFRFSFAFTVDDVVQLKDLREHAFETP